ncbi:hypothetical protein POM88_031258 [Heracleum sosnowskyi]|uniref:Uncharacterized protein n=1 Tax=Heracleum sosnowskyi TaxID=360622 RepID=A0AAD8HXH1_9APIA|nr:hypothetical protein POM88_031258 [Heracleum sosnowskyi]
MFFNALTPEIGLDIGKLQILLSFKKKGARLVEASFSDHKSLVNDVKQVDVVICTMSGNSGTDFGVSDASDSISRRSTSECSYGFSMKFDRARLKLVSWTLVAFKLQPAVRVPRHLS